MDHLVDVFESFYSSRIGLRSDTHESVIDALETMPYVAHHLGSDVASGLHRLVKRACSEIEMIDLPEYVSEEDTINADELRDALLMLDKLLIHHAGVLEDYIQPHLESHIVERDGEIGEIAPVEISITEKPVDSEYTSID